MNDKKKYCAIKKTGLFGKERWIVKAFKTSQDRDRFLNNQTGFAHQQFVQHDHPAIPKKSGTYVCIGGSYSNIRNLEPFELTFV